MRSLVVVVRVMEKEREKEKATRSLVVVVRVTEKGKATRSLVVVAMQRARANSSGVSSEGYLSQAGSVPSLPIRS